MQYPLLIVATLLSSTVMANNHPPAASGIKLNADAAKWLTCMEPKQPLAKKTIGSFKRHGLQANGQTSTLTRPINVFGAPVTQVSLSFDEDEQVYQWKYTVAKGPDELLAKMKIQSTPLYDKDTKTTQYSAFDRNMAISLQTKDGKNTTVSCQYDTADTY